MKLTEKITIDGVPQTYSRADLEEWLEDHGRRPQDWDASSITVHTELIRGEYEYWRVSAKLISDSADCEAVSLGWFIPLKVNEVVESEPRA